MEDSTLTHVQGNALSRRNIHQVHGVDDLLVRGASPSYPINQRPREVRWNLDRPKHLLGWSKKFIPRFGGTNCEIAPPRQIWINWSVCPQAFIGLHRKHKRAARHLNEG